jgi:hypothetical protein
MLAQCACLVQGRAVPACWWPVNLSVPIKCTERLPSTSIATIASLVHFSLGTLAMDLHAAHVVPSLMGVRRPTEAAYFAFHRSGPSVWTKVQARNARGVPPRTLRPPPLAPTSPVPTAPARHLRPASSLPSSPRLAPHLRVGTSAVRSRACTWGSCRRGSQTRRWGRAWAGSAAWRACTLVVGSWRRCSTWRCMEAWWGRRCMWCSARSGVVLRVGFQIREDWGAAAVPGQDPQTCFVGCVSYAGWKRTVWWTD